MERKRKDRKKADGGLFPEYREFVFLFCFDEWFLFACEFGLSIPLNLTKKRAGTRCLSNLGLRDPDDHETVELKVYFIFILFAFLIRSSLLNDASMDH